MIKKPRWLEKLTTGWKTHETKNNVWGVQCPKCDHFIKISRRILYAIMNHCNKCGYTRPLREDER